MKTTTLILIRHVESTKNTEASFSKKDGSEILTSVGKAQARMLGKEVSRFVDGLEAKQWAIVCSPTARCIDTGNTLFSEFEIESYSKLIPLDDLAPIISPYPGLTEHEVMTQDPNFMSSIKEYRKGLINAYDIPRGNGEQIREFENRVISAVSGLLVGPEELVFIIGHRSTITAILLWAARVVSGYPSNWYGHIPIALGDLSSVTVKEEVPVSFKTHYGD